MNKGAELFEAWQCARWLGFRSAIAPHPILLLTSGTQLPGSRRFSPTPARRWLERNRVTVFAGAFPCGVPNKAIRRPGSAPGRSGHSSSQQFAGLVPPSSMSGNTPSEMPCRASSTISRCYGWKKTIHILQGKSRACASSSTVSMTRNCLCASGCVRRRCWLAENARRRKSQRPNGQKLVVRRFRER